MDSITVESIFENGYEVIMEEAISYVLKLHHKKALTNCKKLMRNAHIDEAKNITLKAIEGMKCQNEWFREVVHGGLGNLFETTKEILDWEVIPTERFAWDKIAQASGEHEIEKNYSVLFDEAYNQLEQERLNLAFRLSLKGPELSGHYLGL